MQIKQARYIVHWLVRAKKRTDNDELMWKIQVRFIYKYEKNLMQRSKMHK